jgi:beta-galactosidase
MSLFLPLDLAWNFRRLPSVGVAGSDWCSVDLPHNPFVADLDGRDHWFGECEYQRTVALPAGAPGGPCTLYIGAAMHTAVVFVDGIECGRHAGGYLPFEVDLTDALRGASRCEVKLRLDNRNNPDVPPGKPFEELDFCWYGGLYREVELRVKPALHITDAVTAGEIGGGGTFLRTLKASAARAVVATKTHVRNTSVEARPVRVRVSLRREGVEVAFAASDFILVPPGSSLHVEQQLTVEHPQLWSPDSPALHEAVVTLFALDGTEVDSHRERFGLRRIAVSRSSGFVVNGRRLRLRGTNRHQEYPRVGYAAPRAAQYRDAVCIKEAGFDYVRLSHYPQSPHFLDACDELGIVVMNCIPGWQFIGGPRFRESCYEATRYLIRRDRNHASVVLWELSLNETPMDEVFVTRLHAIGHEEYPGDQMYTCGWIDRYDVFSHSRQHGEIHRWASGDKALVIAEYGDWEYFARNEGFDQKSGAGVFDRWSSSRQFRADGERGLRQQAFNHMMALNDTLASPAVLDGQWAVFDYARGYDPERAAVGVMDIFRLPKFSYYFYRSQRDVTESGTGWTVGAVIFIASHWTVASDLRILVFSNCEEVELRLNGIEVARRRPAQTALTQHLPHPPFFFDLPRFTPGRLEAIGYIAGQARASHVVATPRPFECFELAINDMGVAAATSESDVLVAHARLCDINGTLCIDETSSVTFATEGSVEVVGPSTVAAEAGIASIVLHVPANSPGFALQARTADIGAVPAALFRWQKAARFPASVLQRHELVPLK